MLNQELFDYIKQQLTSGTSKEEIKKILLEAGWQENYIVDAISQATRISGKKYFILVLIAALLISAVALVYFINNKNKVFIPSFSNSPSLVVSAPTELFTATSTPKSTDTSRTPVPTKTPMQKILEKFATITYDGPIYSQGAPDVQRVLRKFYETHPDVYDFIVIYSAIPTSFLGTGFTVKNGIRGNGSFYPDLDETAKYGSQGKLLFGAFMSPQLGVDNPDLEAQSYYLLHEVSHYWLMFIGDIEECKARPDSDVKCKNTPTGFRVNSNGAHWASNVDTAVRENGILYQDPNTYGESATAYNYNNGFCTRVTSPQSRQFRFNDLDLYLMGFISSNETKPIYWYDFTDASELGQKCTQHTLSAQDVINTEGARQPAHPAAQRDFKIGFVLLTAPGQSATPQQINRVNYIIDNFPTSWNEATRKKSTMSIPL